jgi:hypothetical protein
VREIDWRHPPVELERAALQSWREHLVQLLAGRVWRAESPYRARPLRRTDRRWGPRLIQPAPKPIEVSAGDWVEVRMPVPGRPYCLGRRGRVHLVFWYIRTWPHPRIGRTSCTCQRRMASRRGGMWPLLFTE